MSTLYDRNFYQSQSDGSVRSASIVIPIVLEFFKPRSVVDVGCGTGGWARVFADHGVADYLGVDGDYVDRSMLRIPPERFRAADLRKPLALGRGFDLACCLEVAEHLPPAHARGLVDELTALADIVLFSAAIPHQGGTDHVNEQWQSHWADLFAQRGYIALDCVRPRIYGNAHVEWWYQQNILMFCKPARCPAGCVPVTQPFVLDRIHPQALRNARSGPHSGAEAVTAIVRGIRVIARKVIRKVLALGRS